MAMGQMFYLRRDDNCLYRVDADLIKYILNPSNINNAKLICRFLKVANAIRNEDINLYRLIIF